MKKKDRKDSIIRSISYMVIIAGIMGLITIFVAIFERQNANDNDQVSILSLLIIIDLIILFTFLFLYPIVTDRFGNIKTGRYDKDSYMNDIVKGIFEISIGLIVLILIFNNVLAQLFFSLCLLNGIEFITFAYYYYNKEKQTIKKFTEK